MLVIKLYLKQTNVFYKRAEANLVDEVPMRTYLKHRYSTAVDVELIEKDQFPEHKDIWVLNTSRFIRKKDKNNKDLLLLNIFKN